VPFAALGADLRSDRHDDPELAPLDETGHHAGDDVIGLDQPGVAACETLEGAGAE
jgi:hypothetical protein